MQRPWSAWTVREAVVEEAAAKGVASIISHHPVIFKGLKPSPVRTMCNAP